MLAIQKKYTTYLQELKSSLGNENFTFDQTLLETIQNTELLVPVVGAFSAGKSSLLNDLLGSDFLPVGIAPETELATELRYSATPRLIAVKQDGSEEVFPIRALCDKSWSSSGFLHLRLYVDSEPLKQLHPFVLVDMPGYGSSLENHNQAIAYYQPRGVHFIVVTSVEDGTLTESNVRNMEVLERYGAGFTCVLSKCNLRATGTVNEVRSHIDSQLTLYFGDEVKSLPIGQSEGSKLIAAMSALDANAMFTNLFLESLKNHSFDLLDQISLALSVLGRDKATNEQTMISLQQALDKLLGKREELEEQTRSRYSGKLIERAIKRVESALNEALEELVGYASTGTGTSSRLLGNAITDIVRDSLADSIRVGIGAINNDMIDQLSQNLPKAQGISTDKNNNEWNEALAAKVKQGLERSSTSLYDWSRRTQDRLQDKSDEMDDSGKRLLLYKGVSTAIAVSTNVAAPVIELVIIFLPEIISYFTRGNEREKVRRHLVHEVFPDIKSRLRENLPTVLEEQLTLSMQAISQQFEEQIEKQQHIVEAGQLERQAKEANLTARTDELKALSQRVNSLAQEYLYE